MFCTRQTTNQVPSASCLEKKATAKICKGIYHAWWCRRTGRKTGEICGFLTFRCQELDSIFLHCRFSLATFVLNRSAWWCEKRNINPMSSSTSVATIGAYGCSTVSNKGRRRNWKEGWRPAMTTTGNATKSPAATTSTGKKFQFESGAFGLGYVACG